jgi:uncharacterized SAM-binding protein YcdF (DUF218 family)
MPLIRSRHSGRSRVSIALLLVGVLVAVAIVWSARSLGHLLHHDDPLERADVIVVLAGSWLARVAEAGDLYREGLAPLIVLSRELPDDGERALRAKGIDVPGVTDVQVRALVAMGVPRDAIFLLEPQEATATEAARVGQLAPARGWRTIIVVTDKLHTARARLVMQRHLEGTGARVLMRGSRYDPADVDHWWRRRTDLRFALFEAQKMLAYAMGLAD